MKTMRRRSGGQQWDGKKKDDGYEKSKLEVLVTGEFFRERDGGGRNHVSG